jgi:hypothetical protein
MMFYNNLIATHIFTIKAICPLAILVTPTLPTGLLLSNMVWLA